MVGQRLDLNIQDSQQLSSYILILHISMLQAVTSKWNIYKLTTEATFI
jgi:hypothetical protein